MPRRLVGTRVVLGALSLLSAVHAIQAEGWAGTYTDLLAPFEDFRAFERLPMPNGVPDYRARTLAALAGSFDGVRPGTELCRVGHRDVLEYARVDNFDRQLVSAGR